MGSFDPGSAELWGAAMSTFTGRLVAVDGVTHIARGTIFQTTDCGKSIPAQDAQFFDGKISRLTCPACRRQAVRQAPVRAKTIARLPRPGTIRAWLRKLRRPS